MPVIAARLKVLLNDLPVGRLSLDENDRSEFRLLPSYLTAYPRPVLGQYFLDAGDSAVRSNARLPAWFANLLPEKNGPLRKLIAEKAGVKPEREFQLLALLGENLPGAVRVIADNEEQEENFIEDGSDVYPEHSTSMDTSGEGWRFSLAGVQLKFSAIRSGRGLTIPAHARNSDWIVKLPDSRFPNVPENEFATMQWAKDSGINIPEIALVPIADISGLPPEINQSRENYAFAIRRFDRPQFNQRTHIEDFAQILNLYPEDKYRKYNYETLGKLILVISGEAALKEFIQRLTFVILSGNGDAHHKNWSLLYDLDGVNAMLSPAYDLVSTIQYIEKDSLALNLAKSKQWTDISLAGFRRMARKIDIEESKILDWANTAIEAVRQAWREGQTEFGYTKSQRHVLQQHIDSIHW